MEISRTHISSVIRIPNEGKGRGPQAQREMRNCRESNLRCISTLHGPRACTNNKKQFPSFGGACLQANSLPPARISPEQPRAKRTSLQQPKAALSSSEQPRQAQSSPQHLRDKPRGAQINQEQPTAAQSSSDPPRATQTKKSRKNNKICICKPRTKQSRNSPRTRKHCR